ncbi:MAG: UDP-glucose 4-epimerase [Myxococcales bacterium]|nr:UDP-glucose 4-epimerase [Myxococcales bacterium]
MSTESRHILLTGGAGYLGAVLTPKLLERGHRVTCLDCLLFGEGPLASVRDHAGFTLLQGDIRDHDMVTRTLREGDFDQIIHLAAISNDPSSELDHELTRDVNLKAVEHIMTAAREHGVRRFIYASSASVYGIKEVDDVHEDLPLDPITIYARCKAEGETILNGLINDDFCGVSVRAATVCGYSPRLRLDLTINILTSHAILNRAIRVFGGSQMRPNIHIEDLTDFYVELVEADRDLINGEAFNISHSNATVMGLAEMIRDAIDPEIEINVVPTDDLRSYHLSADKVARVLGYQPKRALVEAVNDLRDAFAEGRIPAPDAAHYRNVVLMKENPEFWTHQTPPQA